MKDDYLNQIIDNAVSLNKNLHVFELFTNITSHHAKFNDSELQLKLTEFILSYLNKSKQDNEHEVGELLDSPYTDRQV